jgi:hypothetical protein
VLGVFGVLVKCDRVFEDLACFGMFETVDETICSIVRVALQFTSVAYRC